jgi:hypothetical protein
LTICIFWERDGRLSLRFGGIWRELGIAEVFGTFFFCVGQEVRTRFQVNTMENLCPNVIPFWVWHLDRFFWFSLCEPVLVCRYS